MSCCRDIQVSKWKSWTEFREGNSGFPCSTSKWVSGGLACLQADVLEASVTEECPHWSSMESWVFLLLGIRLRGRDPTVLGIDHFTDSRERFISFPSPVCLINTWAWAWFQVYFFKCSHAPIVTVINLESPFLLQGASHVSVLLPGSGRATVVFASAQEKQSSFFLKMESKATCKIEFQALHSLKKNYFAQYGVT